MVEIESIITGLSMIFMLDSSYPSNASFTSLRNAVISNFCGQLRSQFLQPIHAEAGLNF